MTDAQNTYLRASILSGDEKNNYLNDSLNKQNSQDVRKVVSSRGSKDPYLAKFKSIDHGSTYAEQDKNLILPFMVDEDCKGKNKSKNKKRKL